MVDRMGVLLGRPRETMSCPARATTTTGPVEPLALGYLADGVLLPGFPLGRLQHVAVKAGPGT